MMTQQLHARVAAVQQRQKRALQWTGRVVALTAAVALSAGLLLLFPQGGIGVVVVMAAVTGVLLGAAEWVTQQRAPSMLETARTIEQHYPHLDARLVTAIEIAPDVTTGRMGLLSELVIRETLAQAHVDEWPSLVPAWKIWGPRIGAALQIMLLGAIVAVALRPQAPSNAMSLAGLDGGVTEEPFADVKVEPGDVDLERGTSLLVLARFPEPLPSRVSVHVHATNIPEWTQAAEKSLDDPVFGSRIANVMHDLSYTVQFDGRATKAYKVTVFDYPALVRSDLLVQSPEYTGQSEKLIENAFEATMVEGAKVTVRCRVNKAIKSAELVNRSGERTALVVDPKDPTRYSVTLSPMSSQRYRLELIDERDRKNRDPDEYRIDIVPNRPPKFELAFPGKDVRVSPLEELAIEGKVMDEYGLDEVGIVLQPAGQDPVTVPLGKEIRGSTPFVAKTLQAMEDFGVAPDDLVAFYLYAVDRDRHGQPRRATSDLYFAEVRAFEETFRQMDNPNGASGAKPKGASSPSGAQGNQIEKILQQQKQIVTATWNVQRAERTDWKPADADKINTVAESQKLTRNQLIELIPHLTSQVLQSIAATAVVRMDAAEKELLQANEKASADPLLDAIGSEQAAYQALLKLRAKDHRIMQGQQSGGGSGASASPSEQQMEQLELSDKKNRYEQQQSSGDQAASAQQEDLAVLDRLKEIARRQNDLNEKLKELEAALRLAETESQREEIQRQLKRLRDDQQQLLHDTDELRNKLAQSQRQEKFSEAKQQLDEARTRQLDATEALREGRLSQAISSSTRAERDLDKLQQDFRQQTSARFAEGMRELRDQARQLVEQEKTLAEKLAETNKPNTRSLRQNEDKQKLVEEFEQQRQALKDVLKQAKDMVQEAESAEPLLSQQLYDAVRQSRDTKVEPALDAIPQLVQRGFVPEAQRAEEIAREGLEKLERGIATAAEAVLGNEVEALKRAKSQVADLAQQLQQGFGSDGKPQASGENGTPQEGDGASGSKPAPNGESKPGEGTGKSGEQPGSEKGKSTEESDKPGQPSGKSPGKGTQPGNVPGQGEGQQSGEGQQPGQGKGQGPGSQPGQGNQPGQGGEQPGQGRGNAPGSPSSPRGNPSLRGQPGGQRSASGSPQGGRDQGGTGGGNGAPGGPLSNEEYREWSSRLRDVESMLTDPTLQAEVTKLREQARSIRAESKRHSQAPEWSLVKTSLYEPMVELQQRLAEEVAKREAKETLVPIDRDPVPARYRDLVRSYNERLGRGDEK